MCAATGTADDPAPPAASHRFGVLLFGAALVPRLYVALAWTREPVWDGQYYDIGARSIAAGRGYVGLSGGAWCHYPVGYSAVLGAAYRIAGTGQYVAPVLNALIGAALALLVYLLARRHGSERRARWAGAAVAAYPGLVAYTALLMTEPLASLALVAAAWAASRSSGSLRGMVAAGALTGLATMVRPQSILCAPALAFFSLSSIRQHGAEWRRRAMSRAAVATVTALLVVLPWTARNCVVMDGCALVSTNAGWNLAIGSLPRATGRFVPLHSTDGCRVVTGQVQQDRCWWRLAMHWIAADPQRWFGLMPAKLGHTLDHESFAIGYLGEADPQGWPAPRQALGRAVLSWSHRLLLSLAALASLPWPSRRRPASLLPTVAMLLVIWFAASSAGHPFWLVGVALLATGVLRWRWLAVQPDRAYATWVLLTLLLTHAVFFGEDRYHLVVTPLLCLLAAGLCTAGRLTGKSRTGVAKSSWQSGSDTMPNHQRPTVDPKRA